MEPRLVVVDPLLTRYAYDASVAVVRRDGELEQRAVQ